MKMLTANTAIWAGQVWINVPVFVLIFSPVGLLALLAFPWLDRQSGAVAVPLLIGLFLLGLGLAWLWWSVMISHWRIWAWSRVADIEDLRRRAVRGGLIWPEGHVFERTELRGASTKQMIRELEAKRPPRA